MMAMKDTVKKLFGKVLSIGTPPEKEVLYKEVIKRKVPKESAEKIMLSDIKGTVKNLFTHKEKDVEFSRGTVNPPVKKALKKKATSKKSTVKKPATKKSTTTTKKKTETTPKTKTTAKTTTAKKSTDAKVATTKTSTTKTSTTKKPATKKSAATTKKKAETVPGTKTTTTKSTETKVATKSTAKTPAKKPVTKKSTATTKKKTETTPKTKAVTAKATTKAPAKKSTSAKKGSKRDEKIALYIKDIKKHYGEVDEDFVAIVVKNLGPSIYRKDAELVSCSDPKELDTVRRNFLIKKLGIDASKAVLDAAIQDVCEELKGVRTKYRATFYYTLAKKFKKESVLN